jgi:hypothetical protein
VGSATDKTQVHIAHQGPNNAAAAPPKGIKRSIGGPKLAPPPIPQHAEVTAPDIQDTPAPIASRPKGIKRTIGGPRPAVQIDAGQALDRETVASFTPVVTGIPQERNANVLEEPEKGEPELEEAAWRADDKRRALERQLAQGSAPKPKKRKF